MFLNPSMDEVLAARRLLDVFGEASGLKTNFTKSSLSPIRCNGINPQPLADELHCKLTNLPCTYLGLPLTVTRLTRNDLQPIIDKMLNKMATWNRISSMAGRLTLLSSVIYAMPVFQIMAVHPPVWFIKKIAKAARGFLWANKEVATAGKCLANWKLVCSPKVYGGLGITDLATRSIALRCRWLWQKWMDPTKPWTGLPLPIDDKVTALFEASTTVLLGDGQATQFWTDKWHSQGKFSTTFPDLFKLCTLRSITVSRALEHGKWIKHFRSTLSPAAIQQFVRLWTLLRPVTLTVGLADQLVWKWTADGSYSARSAYEAQFVGLIKPTFPQMIWRSDAPPKCKLYAWLAVQGKCMTADVLAKKGCPHDPLCCLCRAEPETALHLLATCPFSLQVWDLILDKAELPLTLAPGQATSLADWICSSKSKVETGKRKMWTSVIPLVWWCLWKERNGRIFRHESNPPVTVFQNILTEANSWIDAGRRRVLALADRPREPD
jgi:hypothetical protein